MAQLLKIIKSRPLSSHGLSCMRIDIQHSSLAKHHLENVVIVGILLSDDCLKSMDPRSPLPLHLAQRVDVVDEHVAVAHVDHTRTGRMIAPTSKGIIGPIGDPRHVLALQMSDLSACGCRRRPWLDSSDGTSRR